MQELCNRLVPCYISCKPLLTVSFTAATKHSRELLKKQISNHNIFDCVMLHFLSTNVVKEDMDNFLGGQNSNYKIFSFSYAMDDSSCHRL